MLPGVRSFLHQIMLVLTCTPQLSQYIAKLHKKFTVVVNMWLPKMQHLVPEQPTTVLWYSNMRVSCIDRKQEFIHWRCTVWWANSEVDLCEKNKCKYFYREKMRIYYSFFTGACKSFHLWLVDRRCNVRLHTLPKALCLYLCTGRHFLSCRQYEWTSSFLHSQIPAEPHTAVPFSKFKSRCGERGALAAEGNCIEACCMLHHKKFHFINYFFPQMF